MKRFVSLSDIHYPYEDADVMNLVSAFVADFQPTDLILNGDIYDCPTISKYHSRRLEVVREIPLQEQIDYGVAKLDSLVSAAGAKNNIFIQGNHCDRLQLYLGTQAKALASLRTLEFESLFQVKGFDKVLDYGDGYQLNDDLLVYHGTFIGQTALRKELERAGTSTITGHGHTQGVTYHTSRKGTRKAIAQGCLCKLDPPYSRIPTQWQQGFAYGYLLPGDKFRAVEVELVRGEDDLWMMPEGKVYTTKIGSGKVRT